MKKLANTFVSLLLALIISSQNCLPALSAGNNKILKISASPVTLNSDLAKHSKGYEVRLKNIGTNPIAIENLVAQTGLSGEDVYHEHKKKSGAVTGLWVAAGLFWWLFFVPVLIAVVGTPIIAIKNNKLNKASWEESSKFTNKLQQTKIEPNQTISFLTLTRLDSVLAVNVTYRDTVTKAVTNEILNL